MSELACHKVSFADAPLQIATNGSIFRLAFKPEKGYNIANFAGVIFDIG